jgi:hypothetical protein
MKAEIGDELVTDGGRRRLDLAAEPGMMSYRVIPPGGWQVLTVPR